MILLVALVVVSCGGSGAKVARQLEGAAAKGANSVKNVNGVRNVNGINNGAKAVGGASFIKTATRSADDVYRHLDDE